MFSRLFSVRLKAAENALREGRLEEAHRLATAADLRQHRRATAVLATLTERFLERARRYYRDERFAEALMDLDRAEAGGVMKEEINELRGYVQTVAAEHQRKENARRERVDEAARRIADGSLAAGRNLLERASPGDPVIENLRQKLNERAEDAAQTLQHAEVLIASGQFSAAAERVRRAKAIDAHNEAVARVEAALCKRVLEDARAALVEGKLGRAGDELGCLGDLGKALSARRELGDLLTLAKEVGVCVQAERYLEARRHAMSLARQVPEARWIETAVEQLRQLEEVRTALCTGPFGERIAIQAGKREAVVERGHKRGSLDETVGIPGRVVSDSALPERLLLLVDGGGSFLVLRGGRASVGRAASETPADVPIFSDVAERHAHITRVDDDYFLFSAKEVEVAGRPTQHTLLRDGDRIVLGRKAKMTFRLPSRKSPSAVLEMSDTTKMPNDVRRVVLLHQHASMGHGPTAHIPCRHAGPALVLFERHGGLWIRPQSDGHVDTEAKELRMGESTEIAGVSLVVERWKLPSPGGAKRV